jgi:L-erythro-3,5-diaminohexanoate dehydrogenase
MGDAAGSIRSEKGCPFGSHRAGGGLPQPAQKLDASLPIWSNELLIDVETLNLDSSSMRQIAESCDFDSAKMKDHIAEIVQSRGKMHNPVTDSGGVLIGRVAAIGPHFSGRTLQVGDRICTMVSLSLTPLVLDHIHSVNWQTAQVTARGHAVLFETGLFAQVPDDIPLAVVLALLDIAGAPATVLKTVRPGDTVCIMGAGKAGTLCLFAARQALGATGRLIAVDGNAEVVDAIRTLGIADEIYQMDLRNPIEAFETLSDATNGALADLTVNTTNIAGTEGAAILSTRQGGRIFFFSMATSFTRAALTAEGAGRDVQMLIGNGYTAGWVDMTFQLYRDNPALADFLKRRLQHAPF